MTYQHAKQADLWFDPMDPWSWVVSRWLLEVEQVREVDVRLHVMSVALLNADREIPERYRDDPEAFLARMQAAWGPVRVATAAVAGHGDAVLRDLYTALGTRIHAAGDKDFDRVVREALEETGLPAGLADAARSTAYDERIRAANKAAMEPVGLEIGTPILHLDGTGLFGPVISEAPRGEDAGQLYDALSAFARFPHLSEVKRARISEPVVS